jgi:hypothetical protein
VKDYVSVHKYEKYFYQLGKIPARESQQQRFREIKEEMSDERKQIHLTIEKAYLALEKEYPEKKRGAKPSNKRREAIQEKFLDRLPSVEASRAEARRLFGNQMEELLSITRQIPSLANQPWDGYQEALISNFFRKKDLLHAKITLALATRSASDAREVHLYQDHVNGAERRLAHELVFGDTIPYEDVIQMQKEALITGMVNEVVSDLWDKIYYLAIDQFVTLAESDDPLKEEDELFSFSGNEGTESPVRTKEHNRRENVRRMFDGDLAEERRGPYSLAYITHLAKQYMAAYAAKIGTTHNLTQEQIDNSNEFLRNVWKGMSDKLEPMIKGGEKAKEYILSIWEEVKKRVRWGGKKIVELWDTIPTKITRAVTIIALLMFALYALGIGSHWYSAKGPVADALQGVNTLKGTLSGLREDVKILDYSVKGATKALDAVVVEINAEGTALLNIKPAPDLDLNSMENLVVIETSLDNQMRYAEGLLANPEITGNVRNVYIPTLVKTIENYRELDSSPQNIAAKREAFYAVQDEVRFFTGAAMAAGLNEKMQKIKAKLNVIPHFLKMMGFSTQSISDIIDKQQRVLDKTGTSLFNASARLLKTERAAPMISTKIQDWGLIDWFPFDPALVDPAKQAVATALSYNLYYKALLDAMGHFMQQESRMFEFLQAAMAGYNIWSVTGMISFIMRLCYSMATTSHFWITLCHTITGIEMFKNIVGLHLRAVAEATKLIFAFAATCSGNSENNLLYHFVPSDKLVAVVAKLRDQYLSSDEERLEEAIKLLGHEPTAEETQQLLQLILYKDGIVTKSKWVNEKLNYITSLYNDGFKPVYYIASAVTYSHCLSYYWDFFAQIHYILSSLISIIPYPIKLGAGIFTGLTVLLICLSWKFGPAADSTDSDDEASYSGRLNKLISGKVPGIGALIRLAWNNRYNVMMAVNLTYMLCAYFYGGYQKVEEQRVARDETGWAAATKSRARENESVAEVNQTLEEIRKNKELLEPTYFINNHNISPIQLTLATDTIILAVDPRAGSNAGPLIDKFKELIYASNDTNVTSSAGEPSL